MYAAAIVAGNVARLGTSHMNKIALGYLVSQFLYVVRLSERRGPLAAEFECAYFLLRRHRAGPLHPDGHHQGDTAPLRGILDEYVLASLGALAPNYRTCSQSARSAGVILSLGTFVRAGLAFNRALY